VELEAISTVYWLSISGGSNGQAMEVRDDAN
jgi:hypothetical protein